jgi:hypothetical protein
MGTSILAVGSRRIKKADLAGGESVRLRTAPVGLALLAVAVTMAAYSAIDDPASTVIAGRGAPAASHPGFDFLFLPPGGYELGPIEDQVAHDSVLRIIVFKRPSSPYDLVFSRQRGRLVDLEALATALRPSGGWEVGTVGNHPSLELSSRVRRYVIWRVEPDVVLSVSSSDPSLSQDQLRKVAEGVVYDRSIDERQQPRIDPGEGRSGSSAVESRQPKSDG